MKYSLRSLMKWSCVAFGLTVAFVGQIAVIEFDESYVAIAAIGLGLGIAIVGFAYFSLPTSQAPAPNPPKP